MTGNPDVIKALRAALPLEAHLNLQYRKDWRNVKFKGLDKLRKKIHGFGSDAHDWMKKITDRILFLGGDDSYSIPPITSPDSLTALFQNELALEMVIVPAYETLINTATGVDATTVHKFQHLQMYHERHVAWLEQQLDLINTLTEPMYIQEKL